MIEIESLPDRERAWRWRDDALGDVEFLHAHYVTHSFAPHTHDGYAFGVIEAGAEGFWYRGALRVALPGQVIALNPDELHTGGAAPGAAGWQYRMIYPAPGLVEHAAAAVWGRRGTPTFPEPVVEDPGIAGALQRLHRRVASRAGALAEGTALTELLALLTQRHATEYRREPRRTSDARLADRVQSYLDAHFRRNVTLAELAEHSGVSPFHLARIFHAARGIPPHRYLEQRRVREARELIRAGHSLARTADGAGFADQSQMTRHFKRHLGVTPGRYRRAVLGRAEAASSLD